VAPQRARPVSPAKTLPNANRSGRTGSLEVPKRQFDLYHMLSAVVGAYVGLVFFSLITPGQIPHEAAAPTPDPRGALTLVHLSTLPGSDGMFHVKGDVHNAREKMCRIATVTVRFFSKENREVTETVTTVEQIAGHGDKPFEVRVLATGAVRFEAVADLAQF
jgi:hypothetical protein